MSEAAELYDRDFYAWTQDQAALLRAWPEALRPNALDIANLAEEVESLGRSDRRSAESYLFRIILHLLKLRAHPDRASRDHWQDEVAAFRDSLERVFRDSPSLRGRRAELAAAEWSRAARQFGKQLQRDGHDPRAALAWLADPDAPFFDLDAEVLNEDWFPPEPAA